MTTAMWICAATLLAPAPEGGYLRVDPAQPTRLLDSAGQPIVSNLIGVNDQELYAQSIEEIGRTGANCVRMFWMTNGNVWVHGLQNQDTPQRLASLAVRAKKNGMIFIGALWDATGKSYSTPEFERCVKYWIDNAKIFAPMTDNLIVDVANEAGWTRDGDFLKTWNSVVSRLRKAGYKVPIMVDAPDFGRGGKTLFADSDKNGKPDAADILASDPLENVVFSWHLYDPAAYAQGSGTKADIDRIVQESLKADVCFSIGEFAHVESREVTEEKRVEWRHAMETAMKHRVGVLPWMWFSTNDPHSLTTDGRFGNWAEYKGPDGKSIRWGLEAVVEAPWSLMKRAYRTEAMRAWTR